MRQTLKDATPVKATYRNVFLSVHLQAEWMGGQTSQRQWRHLGGAGEGVNGSLREAFSQPQKHVCVPVWLFSLPPAPPTSPPPSAHLPTPLLPPAAASPAPVCSAEC